MKALVTGGAGFIGSHLVDWLMAEGYKVTVIDNLSSGNIRNIESWLGSSTFKFVKRDLKSPEGWVEEFKDVDVVFHYAANPEVRVSVTEPKVHFEENLQVTFNVLEACRNFKVPLLVFSSTSTIYGDAKQIPTPEDYAPLKPISIYGASKLACEILISTYSRLYGLRSLILRYANVIGSRSGHGVLIDFIRKLKSNPTKLEILGDGSQRKSYIHVEDAVNATIKALEYVLKNNLLEEVFNVGSEDWVNVREIADLTVKALNLRDVEYTYRPATEDGRGWLGDVKFMLLDVSKLKRATGWRPKMGSREAIQKVLEELILRS
ncbi:MAG: NAD-dependent epimerase/dehydratase family protein [Nitrososphaerota archaeon]|nr:NAD-dependent epimerase/dehydratase family protein [Candidatus Nezhaarchaeota archaeon]MDW8050001.1 NAD-dependent epimerase/dehydratase family protein [Nitrososphaerota archaeon]